MPPAIISPSILSANFATLGADCERMQSLGADALHVDVMDGHFVPNMSLGPQVVQSIRPYTTLPLDVHLMVTHPQSWIHVFHKAGANGCTFHIETEHVADTLDMIRSTGMKAGIALKPKTPIESVVPYIKDLDMVLIMTVEPGFGGQKMQLDALDKVKWLRSQYPDLEIQVDGGIDLSNIDLVAQSGANNIVSGTGIFKAADPGAAIKTMSQTVNKL
jgi:ribulose-phosphate 3-epimerase